MPRFTPPPSLYKYLPAREDFFDRPCLRFSPTKELNDPFESQLSMIRDSGNMSDVACAWIELLQIRFSSILNILFDNGVLSLSANHKNLLMWAHYTNNHYGMVLDLDSTSDFLKNADKVIYSNERLYFDEIVKLKEFKASLLYRNIFHKSIHWSYEEEWRVFEPWIKKTPSIKTSIVGFIELPIDIIKNIYLGSRVRNSFKESAKEFCNQNNHIGLYQTKLHPTRYDLNFIKV